MEEGTAAAAKGDYPPDHSSLTLHTNEKFYPRFDRIWPVELMDKIEEVSWKDFVSKLNDELMRKKETMLKVIVVVTGTFLAWSLLVAAVLGGSLWEVYQRVIFVGLTFCLSLFVLNLCISRAVLARRRLVAFMKHENESFFHPQGVHLTLGVDDASRYPVLVVELRTGPYHDTLSFDDGVELMPMEMLSTSSSSSSVPPSSAPSPFSSATSSSEPSWWST